MSWKQLSSREVYRNNWMWITEDQVLTEQGKQLTYGIVHKDPFALIVPWDGERFVLVGQYRYPVGRYSWEFPQGGVHGKTTEEMAHQELREETGCTASSLVYKAKVDLANGHHTQSCHVFFATGLIDGEPEPEESEEGMETKRVTFDELRQMITDGTIQDGPTIAAVGLLLLGKWIEVSKEPLL